MFVIGVLNSLSSVLTFKSQNFQQVGCDIHLLASSITPLLTITMFTIKFWFVIVTQMNIAIRLSVLQSGCKSMETLLRFFFYCDIWYQACAAIERAVSAYKEASFDKEKSKCFARWIVFILPIVILSTLVHEPLHRQVHEHVIKERILNIEEIALHR